MGRLRKGKDLKLIEGEIVFIYKNEKGEAGYLYN